MKNGSQGEALHVRVCGRLCRDSSQEQGMRLQTAGANGCGLCQDALLAVSNGALDAEPTTSVAKTNTKQQRQQRQQRPSAQTRPRPPCSWRAPNRVSGESLCAVFLRLHAAATGTSSPPCRPEPGVIYAERPQPVWRGRRGMNVYNALPQTDIQRANCVYEAI